MWAGRFSTQPPSSSGSSINLGLNGNTISPLVKQAMILLVRILLLRQSLVLIKLFLLHWPIPSSNCSLFVNPIQVMEECDKPIQSKCEENRTVDLWRQNQPFCPPCYNDSSLNVILLLSSIIYPLERCEGPIQ